MKTTTVIPRWISAVNSVSRAFGVLSVGLIVVAILVICHMIFVRGVLGESSIWQTEFSTFCVLAATFLGAPYILLTKGHIGVDLLPLMVAGRFRKTLYFVGYLATLVFCGIYLYSSMHWWYVTWDIGQTTSSIWRVPLWIPYISVPIGIGLFCIQCVAEMCLVFLGTEEPFGLPQGKQL